MRNLNIFLKIIEPIINAGCLELKKKIIALAKSAPKGNLPINFQNIVDILAAPLVDTLLRMAYRVFILELNVARLQNRLKGDTSEERFASFIQQYQQKDKSFAILKEYPILARKLITVIDNWISYSSEFVKHLLIDWKAICNIFSPYNNPGILAKIYSSGDTHRGGRSVLIAEFDSGFKIVYKPRSMSVDVHFQELLNWVNTHLDLDFFPITKIMDRKKYGWMEFIPYISCNSSEEVRRFYERIGGYLAILYILDATDFHFENLIANKEFPILIDLESLFQPHIGVRKVEKSEYMAANFILNTVIRTGLLPQRVFVKSDYHGIDLGGVSPIAGQLVPDKMFVLKKAGTDEAMVIPIEAKTQKSYNQPSITNEPVNVLEYVTEIINGFSTVYQLILRYRGKLLQGGSPLMKFRGDEIRVLFRPTRTYSLLLSNSYHPDLLRNALDRDLFLDKLWLAVEENPYLKKVIASEKKDIENNDIPVFTTFIGSRDLYDSDGMKISNFFTKSMLKTVRERINHLSIEDLEKQVYFIRASLSTLELNKHTNGPKKLPISRLKGEYNSKWIRHKSLEIAMTVAKKLEQYAVQGKHDICWVGLTFDNEGYLRVGPLSVDLYSGIPGIILFLSYLSIVCKNKNLTLICQRGLTTLRRLIKRNKSWLRSIGAFSGWGGIIYTYSHLGALWDSPSLFKEAEDLALDLEYLIEKDTYFDIMAGAAGYILSLISLYSCRPTDKILNLAIRAGDHLLANSKELKIGIGWSTATEIPQSGFAHGSSGIALALLKLYSVTKLSRFKIAGLNALYYERTLFDSTRKNWITWDTPSNKTNGAQLNQPRAEFPVAWCYGAVGIGLSRLEMLKCIDEPILHSEIEISIQSTLHYGFGYNHSLCHGDLGNIDFLLCASKIVDDRRLQSTITKIVAKILVGIEKYGFRFSNKFQVETCGLMIGLSGIGYELLRFVKPNEVPSVLMLEPPKRIDKRFYVDIIY